MRFKPLMSLDDGELFMWRGEAVAFLNYTMIKCGVNSTMAVSFCKPEEGFKVCQVITKGIMFVHSTGEILW